MIGRFLTEADVFHFGCQLTGDCCRYYTIYCTPYDIVRLRFARGRTTTEMLAAGEFEIVSESFGALFADEAVGAILGIFGMPPKDLFPIARLRKDRDDRGPRCGYLTEDHRCGVYDHRPGVCRSYPLGRVLTPDGPRWFERKYSCPGKGQGSNTVADWIAESGLAAYTDGNDRFAAFAQAFMQAGRTYDQLSPDHQQELRDILYDFDRALDVSGRDAPATVATIDAAASEWLLRRLAHT